MLRRAWHLTVRFAGSWSTRPPDAVDLQWVSDTLTTAERDLWLAHRAADQRHTVAVGREFVRRRPNAVRAEVAGALLHDIGKLDSALSTLERVAATLFGGRTQRWRSYLDHERIGAEMLAQIGSAPITVDLVLGRGPASADLRQADESCVR